MTRRSARVDRRSNSSKHSSRSPSRCHWGSETIRPPCSTWSGNRSKISRLSTVVSPSRSSSAIARRDAAAASAARTAPAAPASRVWSPWSRNRGPVGPAETTSECALRYSWATFTASWTVPLASMVR